MIYRPTGNEVMTTTVDSQFQKSAKAAQKVSKRKPTPTFGLDVIFCFLSESWLVHKFTRLTFKALHGWCQSLLFDALWLQELHLQIGMTNSLQSVSRPVLHPYIFRGQASPKGLMLSCNLLPGWQPLHHALERVDCATNPARFYSDHLLEWLWRVTLHWAGLGNASCQHNLVVSTRSRSQYADKRSKLFHSRFISTLSPVFLFTSKRNGFDHTAWLDMSDYFIQWYKTGSQPTIKEDTVYYNYRPHSVNAVACMYLSILILILMVNQHTWNWRWALHLKYSLWPITSAHQRLGLHRCSLRVRLFDARLLRSSSTSIDWWEPTNV